MMIRAYQESHICNFAVVRKGKWHDKGTWASFVQTHSRLQWQWERVVSIVTIEVVHLTSCDVTFSWKPVISQLWSHTPIVSGFLQTWMHLVILCVFSTLNGIRYYVLYVTTISPFLDSDTSGIAPQNGGHATVACMHYSERSLLQTRETELSINRILCKDYPITQAVQWTIRSLSSMQNRGTPEGLSELQHQLFSYSQACI